MSTKLAFFNDGVKSARFLVKSYLRKNEDFFVKWIFMRYIFWKLRSILENRIRAIVIPDNVFKYLVSENCENCGYYVDIDSCVLGNVRNDSNCFFLISGETLKKIKVYILAMENFQKNVIYLSETMVFNFKNSMGINDLDSGFFLVPALETPNFAKETKISLISNPYDNSSDLTKTLLENYFFIPRYLRPKEIFKIDVKSHAPDYFYTTRNPKLDCLFFRVNSVIDEDGKNCLSGRFAVKEETCLIQESNVHSFIPIQKIHPDFEKMVPEEFQSFKNSLYDVCPPSLKENLRELKSCIAPFLRKDFEVDLKPIFRIEGPQGSGKYQLVQSVSKILGLHLYDVDFSEFQALASAQVEAKIRIIVQNARTCMPCILLLRNIQSFGTNSEGKKDDRVISSFSSEMKKLYSKTLSFPIIVIATSESSEIPVDLERNFIETVHIKYTNQEKRRETLLWFLKQKGLGFTADLHKVAGLCSDFVLSDLEALILNAAKINYKSWKSDRKRSEIVLDWDDFVKAFDNLQSAFSEGFGAPKIPKVHWDDIGGLSELKHEIKRRIELPLLNESGLGRSGLLLYGPPGTGKTLLAKAVATECQLHFLSVKGPELLNMYVGQSEKNVRQVFEKAREASPCVIFFDELDALAPSRGRSGDSGGIMDRVVSQILAEMDGLENSGTVFVIGATNRPDLVDPSLLRPGRFDKLLYVGVHGDRLSKINVLRALTRKCKMAQQGQELEHLEIPENVTGADLYSISCNAWLSAIRRRVLEFEKTQGEGDEFSEIGGEVVVNSGDFREALENFIPSVSKEEIRRYEELRKELSREGRF